MTTLFDIIESIHLQSKEIDSLFRNKPRYRIVQLAKEGMQKLNLTFATHVKGMNVQIPSSCRVYKPTGFEKFIRVYLINCDGKTIEIKRNSNVPSEIFNYLVSCDGTLLSDSDGNTLKSKCLSCNGSDSNTSNSSCSTCNGTGYCTTDSELKHFLSDYVKYKDSWVKENSEFFEFSADLEDMSVIIEFLSNQTDGIEECAIQVDSKFEEALEYYIKFKLLEAGESTMNASQYFYKKFKAIRDKESIRENALTKTDLFLTNAMK